MNVRSRMVMRTTIERNASAANPWGGPGAPGWEPARADVPCYAWETTGREVLANVVTLVRTMTVLFPSGTDVRNADRLTAITDRAGHTRFPGPIEVTSVTWRPAYVEVQAVSTL